MAQMNKRPNDTMSSNRERLERELIETVEEGAAGQNAEVDTGRSHHPTSWQSMLANKMHSFATKQGIRRRHPDRLLQQHDGMITSSKQNTQSYAADSLNFDQSRVQLPEEYQYDGDSKMLANQYYLVQVAARNAKESREKLMTMVGVMM